MRKKILCSLDIGNYKLTAIIAKCVKQRLNILAVETLAISGLSKGLVKDLASLVDCIQQTIDRLSKKSGIKIRRVSVSINGDHISAHSSFAVLALSEVANRYINLSDINYLRYQVRLLSVRIDETILHEFPQSYILDDTHSTFNPLGLLARKVQLNSFLLSASHTLLGNIKTAINQAGYEVEDVLYSGVASSFSVLSNDEKQKGVILIDIGACFTSLLFYKDGILRDFKIISFGGNDITEYISKGLNLPWELAEEIKKSSLIVPTSDVEHSDKVVIRRGGSYKTLERKAIYESAKNGLEEFFDSIKNNIDSSTWKDKIDCGIVGVGGTANLEGILERIENHTRLPVRIGRVNTSNNDITGPQYAAAVGLVNYSANYKSPSNLNNFFSGRNPFEKIANFVRNVYQDYF